MRNLLAGLLLISTSVFALESGTYSTQRNTDDVIKVAGQILMIEETKQIEGADQISNDGAVLYPMLCRVKVFGKIQSEDNIYVSYSVMYAYLDEGYDNNEHCTEYINEYILDIAYEGLSFPIDKRELIIKP